MSLIAPASQGLATGKRNGAIDCLRFVGAISIVHFHLDLGHRDVTLWGLPFFTLLLTYFGASRSLPERARRLLQPWLFWSLVYGTLLSLLVLIGRRQSGEAFAPWMLLTGPSLHLWFLPFSFLFLCLVSVVPAPGRAVFLAVTTVAALAAVNLLALPIPLWQWASVWPMAALGWWMARSAQPWIVAALACAGFVILQQTPFAAQTIPNGIAAGAAAAALALRMDATPLTRGLSDLSLGIYLVHPIFISVLERSFGLEGHALFAGAALASVAATWMLRPLLAPRFL